MLLDKEEMDLSWERWNAHQKQSDSPVMRNRLQALSRRLLSAWPPAIPLQSCSGAYLRPLDVFDKLVQQYCKQGLFFVSPSAPRQDVLLFKLAADNRPIFDRPNEALFMQPLSVRNPQSVGHVVTFCIAAVPEKDHVLDSVAVEVGLPELFRILGQRQVLYEDKLMRCDFVFTADWVTHVLELGIELPNASQSDSQTCWCCYVAFEERTNTWRRDPFEFHFVNRHDNSTFCRRTVANCVPATKRRYCWGHGCARLLTNTLSRLYTLLPAKQQQERFAQLLAIALERPWSTDTSLDMKRTKRFFEDRSLIGKLSDTFVDVDLAVPLWPSTVSDSATASTAPRATSAHRTVQLTSVAAVRLVLSCVKVYQEFAYTRWPSSEAFRQLWKARTAYLGFFAANDFTLTPSTHYMLNHAIEWAIIDRTAYYTVNEGIEVANKVDKQEARRTSHGELLHTSCLVAWVQLLEHEQLQRALQIQHRDTAGNESDTSSHRADVTALYPLAAYEIVLPPNLKLPE
jgi:hypothetical protein